MLIRLAVPLLAVGCSSDSDGGSAGGSAGDQAASSQSGGSDGSGATGGDAGGSSGTGTGGGGGVPDCCGVDQPCPSGYSCQGTRDELFGNVGSCEPTPTDGSCYTDIDCPADGICIGVTTCGCDVVCFAPPSPGTCEPMGEPCCRSTEDCAQGICVGAGAFTKGRCAEPPTDGECYTDDDCTVGTCDGGSACACGTNCPTMLGTCVVADG